MKHNGEILFVPFFKKRGKTPSFTFGSNEGGSQEGRGTPSFPITAVIGRQSLARVKIGSNFPRGNY